DRGGGALLRVRRRLRVALELGRALGLPLRRRRRRGRRLRGLPALHRRNRARAAAGPACGPGPVQRGAGHVAGLRLEPAAGGGTNLILTMAGVSLIDRFGRRTLMLAGSVGYIVSLGATAYSLYSGKGGALLLASLVVFIASHGFGQGAVIWVFLSEIFPNKV